MLPIDNLCPCPYMGENFDRGDWPISSFQMSKRAGCEHCAMMLDAAEAYDPGWTENHKIDGKIQTHLRNNLLRVYLTPFTDAMRLDGKFGAFEIFQYQESSTVKRSKEPFFSSLDIIKDTNSDAAFERASAWLKDCLQHHDHHSEADLNFVPTRLLDVGLLGKDDKFGVRLDSEPKLRLVENTKMTLKSTAYAALSYCWGSDLVGVIKTLKENKNAHCHEIVLENLPKTIRDAVLICQKLEIPYLWVDALCIVQDDLDDWQREAAQMQDVYSSSQVTLAVHVAKSCKDGFLGKQKFGESAWQQNFRTGRKNMLVRQGNPYAYPRSPSALATRGWTFQEGLLPRRLLHFTGEEMAWECSDRHFCECGHIEGLRNPGHTPMLKTKLIDRGGLVFIDRNWIQLIKEYTNRELTFSTDKLIALSGLLHSLDRAKHNSGKASISEKAAIVLEINKPQIQKSGYLAGMFRQGFSSQLLWFAQDRRGGLIGEIMLPLPSNSRPTPYRAPTWSWASIDTPVDFDVNIGVGRYSQELSHITIHDSETFCTPASNDNLFGAVTAGELVLEGFMVPVQLITGERNYNRSSWDMTDNWTGRASIIRPYGGSRWEIACDVNREIEMRKGDSGYSCWIDGNCHFGKRGWKEVKNCDKCNFQMEGDSKFWCLKVATYGADGIHEKILFMVLQRADAKHGLVYERVGVGKIQITEYGNVLDNENLFENGRVETIRII